MQTRKTSNWNRKWLGVVNICSSNRPLMPRYFTRTLNVGKPSGNRDSQCKLFFEIKTMGTHLQLCSHECVHSRSERIHIHKYSTDRVSGAQHGLNLWTKSPSRCMTLDRWIANARVDYICRHILILPIVYRHHWTKSTKDRNDENSISNNIWWSQKLQHIIILQDSGDLNI